MSGRFAKGCTLDRGKHQYTAFEIAKARRLATAVPPVAVDLAAFAPPTMNQTEFSCCEGMSTSGAIVTALAKAGTPLPWIPSQVDIYRLARCLERKSPSEKLADDGTFTNAVIRAITEFGIRPMGPSPAGLFCDVTHANVNEEPKLDELEKDALTLLLGAYRIASTGAHKVQDVKLALASGFAVRVDTEVDQAFEDWIPTRGPYGAPDTANSLGGHAVYCIAYDHDVFTIRNSWGPDWGDGKGNIVVSGEFIKAADVYCWNVRKAAK